MRCGRIYTNFGTVPKGDLKRRATMNKVAQNREKSKGRISKLPHRESRSSARDFLRVSSGIEERKSRYYTAVRFPF